MAGRNGTVLSTAMRLGDLSPERVSFSIERDGEEVTLAGYVSGKRCPVPVIIEHDRIWQEWENVRVDESLTDMDRKAASLLRNVQDLKAVIPGLKPEEAEIIAADPALSHQIMVALKWWAPNPYLSEDADPEAGAGGSPSITADSSPASSDSTASVSTTG
jgi:hypothetical protein